MKDIVSKEIKRLNHLSSELDAVYHEISRSMGLSDSAGMILYTIRVNGESCLLTDIISDTGIGKQTINSALRKLEKEGVLYLEASGGKKKLVCLTEEGKLLAEATVDKLISLENDILASWSEEDRENHIRLTEKYLKDLKAKAKGWERI